MNSRFHGLVILLPILFVASLADAQLQLTEVTDSAGLLYHRAALGFAAGVCAADYDDDGDIDFFAPTAVGFPDQLYRNLGNGQFEEIALLVGVASTDNDRGALWLDYDGDGDLDLLVASDDYAQSVVLTPSSLKLYRQDSPDVFVDVTVDAGLFGPLYGPEWDRRHQIGGLAAGDIDNDGFLDVMVTYWIGAMFLYRNNGAGGFVDVTADAGLVTTDDNFWQPVFFDFNRDGWQDIFVAVDFDTNDLWINQQDGTFQNVASSLGLENLDQNDMGVALGDFNNDGRIDFYVSNVDGDEDRRCHLYRNDTVDGVLAFHEMAIPAGVNNAGWAWGCSFADMDCDALPDLCVTNGWGVRTDATYVFMQQPTDPPTFTNGSAAFGLNDNYWGSCLLAIDYDRDGDLDLLRTGMPSPLSLYENTPDPAFGGFLTIRPRMIEGANRNAIGAVVTARYGGIETARAITCGTSMIGQEPAEAHFGLGGAGMVDSVTVEWPDGTETYVANLPANSIRTITPCPGDLDGDRLVSLADLSVVLGHFGSTSAAAGDGDLDGDGDVDLSDLSVLLSAFGTACP